MKILITGATGFVGKHLVRRCLDEGHDVLVISRNPEKTKSLARVKKAFRNLDEARAELSTVDSIIALAGESVAGARWTKKKKALIRSSRVDASAKLHRVLSELGTKPRVTLSASAIGIYGDRRDEMLDETSQPGSGFLAEVCKAWEAESLRPLAGCRRIALRLGMVLGWESGALKKLLPIFRLGLGGRLGSGKQWMSWIHIDDAVSMILWAIQNPAAQGVFNAVAPTPVLNSDFTRALGNALWRPTVLPVPSFTLKLIFGEAAEVLLGSQRVRPERAIQNGFEFRYRDLEQALGNILHPKNPHA